MTDTIYHIDVEPEDEDNIILLIETGKGLDLRLVLPRDLAGDLSAGLIEVLRMTKEEEVE
jgi:hypothetical protein